MLSTWEIWKGKIGLFSLWYNYAQNNIINHNLLPVFREIYKAFSQITLLELVAFTFFSLAFSLLLSFSFWTVLDSSPFCFGDLSNIPLYFLWKWHPNIPLKNWVSLGTFALGKIANEGVLANQGSASKWSSGVRLSLWITNLHLSGIGVDKWCSFILLQVPKGIGCPFIPITQVLRTGPSFVEVLVLYSLWFFFFLIFWHLILSVQFFLLLNLRILCFCCLSYIIPLQFRILGTVLTALTVYLLTRWEMGKLFYYPGSKSAVDAGTDSSELPSINVSLFNAHN